MFTITIIDGPEQIRGRRYNLSAPNVAVTLRELLRGVEQYGHPRVYLRVDGPVSAAQQRREALARQEAAPER